ncbi:MAG: Re/Si-specific NAD(P)(+) transhydrogenase subunit alpha [Rhodospirillales bacterium]|nr:Re/Si-specific NAD(P)(+) transhydrogenase subunit alpha [Alphaproteobacteria bacterium]USO02842.1 MAG: Re/Si-specific NAD(P)(+) transhydrogenase subunit alpha [Rhodospirillales bacterium]
MTLKIAVPKETSPDEKRVAASPETVKKLAALGASVCLESNAGKGAAFSDKAYKEAGATIVKTATEALKDADIVLRVRPQAGEDFKSLRKNTLLVGMLNPYQNEALIKNCAESGITAFAMELVPRITRAQAMDVLSSQSNLAGYKSVLDAAEHYARSFPMMMTAAGTIAPAKVMVMGAGVAGLQAIATAKRLGAIVCATDVRPAAKEQVQSLGGTFVAVEDDEFKEAETSGGYAREMSKAYQKKQAALIEETIARQDIVITTALIPGRPAPKLISEKMVKSMKPGSVIVDLAVEAGGNCELSQSGKVVEKHGVTIVGHSNTPSRLATDASALYAKNLLSLLALIIKDGALSIDWEDEIIKAIALTKDGDIIHPGFHKEKAQENPVKGKAASEEHLVEEPESQKKTGTDKE